MAYRKKTLRQLHKNAKELAKIQGDLQSIAKRLKKFVDKMNWYEHIEDQLMTI